MPLVYRIQLKTVNTFDDFGKAFFKRIQNFFLHSNIKRIDIVFGRYDDILILNIWSQHYEEKFKRLNIL